MAKPVCSSLPRLFHPKRIKTENRSEHEGVLNLMRRLSFHRKTATCTQPKLESKLSKQYVKQTGDPKWVTGKILLKYFTPVKLSVNQKRTCRPPAKYR